MDLREKIKIEYKELASQLDTPLTRDAFRKFGAYICKTSLIDKLWGSWHKFMEDINQTVAVSRGNQNIVKKVKADKVIITSICDGSDLNMNCWQTLKNYAKQNDCKLVVLWAEGLQVNTAFSSETYEELKNYLCTEVVFEQDSTCIAKDLHIKPQAKDPLLNLDKVFSEQQSHVIVASPKQYLKMLPVECTKRPRVAWSTGTISNINYKDNVNGYLSDMNHTLGGLLAVYNPSLGYYQVRNLVFDGKYIYDVNKIYTKTGSAVSTNASAVVLGDLHFPEEDPAAIKQSVRLINECSAESVFLHDWCSFNSINHHEEGKYLDKLIKSTEDNLTLEHEFSESLRRLKKLVADCPNSYFYIVASNHDNFINKWLDGGEFVKDKVNAKIGAEFFLRLLDQQPIVPGNIGRLQSLSPKDSLKISGYEVASHGHEGIAGAKGSPKSYVKAFDKSVSGHTHSPLIFESAVVVGTNSKLNLPYTGKITNWGQSNVIIHKNGTIQQIFCF